MSTIASNMNRQNPTSPIHDANTSPKSGLLPPLRAQEDIPSASSSFTAVERPTQCPPPITAQPSKKAPLNSKSASSRSSYDSWNPADGSNKDGRPSWWNRWFCRGYGVGCVLCLCGSATCSQERQKQVVDQEVGEKRVG